MNKRTYNLAEPPRTNIPGLDRFLRQLRDYIVFQQGARNPLERTVTVDDIITALDASNVNSEAARTALTQR